MHWMGCRVSMICSYQLVTWMYTNTLHSPQTWQRSYLPNKEFPSPKQPAHLSSSTTEIVPVRLLLTILVFVLGIWWAQQRTSPVREWNWHTLSSKRQPGASMSLPSASSNLEATQRRFQDNVRLLQIRCRRPHGRLGSLCEYSWFISSAFRIDNFAHSIGSVILHDSNEFWMIGRAIGYFPCTNLCSSFNVNISLAPFLEFKSMVYY